MENEVVMIRKIIPFIVFIIMLLPVASFAEKTSCTKGFVCTSIEECLPLAQQGNAEAQYILGLYYSVGKGVKQDKQKSENWYILAAQNGDEEAQSTLAMQCNIDDCTPEKLKWLRKEAKYGFTVAQEALAFLYMEGKHVEQNYRKAFALYELAAKLSSSRAPYHLAYMYEEGKGVKQDKSKAFAWYSLGSDRGDTDSMEVKQELLETLSSDELKKGQEIYVQYKERYVNLFN